MGSHYGVDGFHCGFCRAGALLAVAGAGFLLFLAALASAPVHAQEPAVTPTPWWTEVPQQLTPYPTQPGVECPAGLPYGWGFVTPSPYWEAVCWPCIHDLEWTPTPAPTLEPTPTPTMTVTPTPTPTPTPSPTFTYVVRAQTGAGDCSSGIPIYTGTGEAVVSYTYWFTHTGSATFGERLRMCAISGTVEIPVWATYEWYAEGYQPNIVGEIRDDLNQYDYFEDLVFDVPCGGDWLPMQELESGRSVVLPSPSHEGLVADSIMRIGKWSGCYGNDEVRARLRVTLWIGTPPGSIEPTPTPTPTPTATPVITPTPSYDCYCCEVRPPSDDGVSKPFFEPGEPSGTSMCIDLPGGITFCFYTYRIGVINFRFFSISLDLVLGIYGTALVVRNFIRYLRTVRV